MSHDDNRLAKRGKIIYSFFKKSSKDNKDTPYASNVDTSIPEELSQLRSQVVEQCVWFGIYLYFVLLCIIFARNVALFDL